MLMLRRLFAAATIRCFDIDVDTLFFTAVIISLMPPAAADAPCHAMADFAAVR